MIPIIFFQLNLVLILDLVLIYVFINKFECKLSRKFLCKLSRKNNLFIFKI